MDHITICILLNKGTKATELETKNEKWLSSAHSGATSLIQKLAPRYSAVKKDPLTPPSLKRSVSCIEEDAAFWNHS